MPNPQSAPGTQPGFRPESRGPPFCGLRYALPETNNVCGFAALFFGGRLAHPFYFLFLLVNFISFFPSEGGGEEWHAPRASPLG